MSIESALFSDLHGGAMKAYAAFPGPTPTLPLGNAGDFLGRKPWEVLDDYAKQYGGVVLFWMLGTPTLLVTEPAGLDQIFVNDINSYYKYDPIPALEPLLGTAVPFMAPDQAAWAPSIQKTALTTVVNQRGHAWLGAQIEVIRRAVSSGLAALADQGEVDATESMRRLGFDVFAQMTLGCALSDDNYADFMTMAKVGNYRLNGIPYPVELPSFEDAKERWLAAIRAIVAGVRAAPDAPGDDLTRTAIRTGNPQTDEELVWDLSNVFFGGLFSSATSVVTTLHMLTKQRDTAAPIVDEARALGPSWASISASRGLERAVRESLRLYPPVPIFFRNTVKDRAVTLAGYEVPSNTKIYVSSYVPQRAASRWPDPEAWNPARWTDEVMQENPWGSAYFWPLGRGERTCTGEAMAFAFVKVALATILAESNFAVGEGQTYDGDLFFAVMYPKGMTARFPPRGATASA